MATLYKYLKPVDNLPDPSGPLSIAVSPAVIKEANEAEANEAPAHNSNSKGVKPVSILTFTGKFFSNNSSPDVFVHVVPSDHTENDAIFLTSSRS